MQDALLRQKVIAQCGEMIAANEERLQPIPDTPGFHTQNTSTRRAHFGGQQVSAFQSIATRNTLNWEIVVPATRRGRGSPFQMPARLAVGLGPESDRADGSHQRSPRPDLLGNWVPRAGLQEGKPA